MHTTNFHASTKYADWKGTASADDHDHVTVRQYLTDKGIMKAGEFLVGVETTQVEVTEKTLTHPLYVTLYFVEKSGDYDTVAAQAASQKPLLVRKATTQIPVEEFFGLFKRFEIAITPHGLIDGLDITFKED